MSQAQQQWNELGPGLWQTVFEIELNGTDVYAGGNFTNAGGNSAADYVARWDGCQWNALGPGLNDGVRSIAIVGSDIYVGGIFTLPYPYLARWDGNQWNPVGSGPPGPVWSIVADGSNITVGGGTWNSGYVSKWNGSSWQSLGPNLNGQVCDLAIHGGDLHIGGNFSNANGNPDADGIARWNGSTWQNLGSGIPAGSGLIVWDLLVYNNELYAGGPFVNAGGNAQADHVARWDGNSWHNLGTTPANGFGFYSLCVYQGSLYTTIGAGYASNDGIYSWDFMSGTWEVFQIIELGADDPIIRLAGDDDNLYVGSFSGLGIPGGNYVCIARWGPPGNYEQIPGVMDSLCQGDPPITLPTNINGYTGHWSGPGVFNNEFDPYDQNGVIAIEFTPDPGQCVDPEESEMNVVNLSSSTIHAFCSNNNTPSDETDDIIQIEFIPMGYHIGNAYSVSVSSGSISPGMGSYNTTTLFQMQPGSAGNGNVTVTITDNASPFCSFDFEIEDPGSCSIISTCPPGIDTTYMICPYLEAENNFLVGYGLPPTGTWEPPLQMWGGTVYNSCLDGASVYIYPQDYPGCPTVYDTVHFQLIWDPCGWQPEDVCYTADSIMFTMPPFTGNTSDSMYTLGVSGEPPTWWNSLPNSFDFDSTYEIAVPMPSWYDPGSGGCYQISAAANGCSWFFGELILFDFTCVGGFGGIPPCSCSNPPNAGENNSIVICGDADPFDLTTILGGNPDPGGTWTPPLTSGGNIYDPDLDGSGTFTYTVSSSGCPDDDASVTVTNQQPAPPGISGIPNTICESDPAIALPTNQAGIIGNWSGTGVSNNNFNPSGLNGTYLLTFTPNAGQCALPATTNIIVQPFINLVIAGLPVSLCQIHPPIILPTLQSGIPGNWSGPGIMNNMFNPAGQSGNVILTFIPNAGQCANAVNASIAIEPVINILITAFPDSMCQFDLPFPLPVNPSGIAGVWTGLGISNSTFYPANLSGNIMLTYSPNAGQCANVVNEDIFVEPAINPMISGTPDSLCQFDTPISLPTLQSNITGHWMGPGVTSDEFNPTGLNGNIVLTFTPDTGQCALTTTATVSVIEPNMTLITGVPISICETSPPIALSIVQSGITGQWSGPWVTSNILDTEGHAGIITLVFTPDADQCGEIATIIITINPAITPDITGLPDTLCQLSSALSLPTFIDGINGNWSGPGVVNNTFSPSGLNGTIVLTFTPLVNQCAYETSISMMVNPEMIPVITVIPSTLCQSDDPISLSTDQGGVVGIWSGPGVTNNIFDPSGLIGNVTLTFTPVTGQCADTAQVSLAIHDVPAFLNLQPTCDSSGQFYTVSFDITGGSAGSYMINGIPVGGSVYSSPPFPADSLHYTFVLDDSNGCGPVTIDGSINCACATSAGTMNFAVNPLMICEGSGFEVIHNHDAYLDPDDVLFFILHDQAGNSLGTVYAISDSVFFNFPTGIQLNQVYYISAVAGSGNGNGGIDLNDPCLSVSQGIPIIFYIPQVTISPGNIICPDDCITYELQFIGVSPFEMEFQVIANGIPNPKTIISEPVNASITLCPSEYGMTNGILDIVPITLQDANCVIALNPSGGTSSPVYNASYDLEVMLCPGDSLIVNGSVYNQNHLSGTEILPGASLYGCDSLVNVMLSIAAPAEYHLNQTLCFGSNITINGTVYNELHPAGTETLDHANVHGCDSLVYVLLTFDSVAVGNLTSTICAGDSMVINGLLYHETNATGVQSFPGGSVFGCDSILNIDLHFHPPADYILKDTLCPGESVVINGTVFDINHPEGVDIITNGSHFGCDSSIRVSLIFYPLAAFTIIDTLASGDSLVVNGTVYNQFKSSGLDTIPGGSNKGCDSIIQIELYFRESISAIVKVTAPICYGDSSGLITLEDIQGGLLPFLYSLDQGGFLPISTLPFELHGLSSGFYHLSIKDGGSGLIDLDIEIPEKLPIEVDAGEDQVIEFGGTAILHAEATFNVLQWLWSPEDFLSCIDCPDPIVQMADKDITYTLQAWDSNGCFAFDELGVMIKKDHQVYVPNVFSPNGDGVNDIFMLNSNSENVTIRSLRIFSRWGELVFERENFPPGDPTYSWDGQLQGRGMNPAVFTWFSQVEFAPGAIKYFSGNVTLIK